MVEDPASTQERYRAAVARGLSLEGWPLLAAVIGAASTLFASFFYVLLELATSLSARLVGVEAPLRGYTDLGIAIAVVEYGNGPHARLAVLIVVAAAAAVSSLLVYRLAPGGGGPRHGRRDKGVPQASRIPEARVPW